MEGAPIGERMVAFDSTTEDAESAEIVQHKGHNGAKVTKGDFITEYSEVTEGAETIRVGGEEVLAMSSLDRLARRDYTEF